jgi:outer membrane putative beta-barrel porin/alpha-amylase
MRFRIFERSRSPEDQMRGNPELLQAGDCSGPSQMPVIASKGIRPAVLIIAPVVVVVIRIAVIRIRIPTIKSVISEAAPKPASESAMAKSSPAAEVAESSPAKSSAAETTSAARDGDRPYARKGCFGCAPLDIVKLSSLSLWAFMYLYTFAAAAGGCPKEGDAIVTDRPDVTNSSIAVPVSSLQIENGVNFSARDGAEVLDGTNTRLRLGVAPCLELLVDLPTYFVALRGSASSGFSDVAPAVKWQISPVPGKVDLSAVVGVALPTGTTDIAGRGAQPYVQFPWSWELHDGWGLSGMVTEFIRPADPTSKLVTQTTFVTERKVSEKASLFVEYVGYYPDHSSPSQLINSGGMYRLTPTQQIDFHVAVGLNHNAPNFIFGLGYSIRLDGLLAGNR